MDIRPVDLPLLRDETAAYVLRTGPELYERAISDGRQSMAPMTSAAKGASILTTAEVHRLKEAELFFVTEGMTDLAVAAGAALPEFNLMPEDLPAPTGFILFQKPIAVVDYNEYYDNEGASPIVAACWSPWNGNNPHWVHGGGVWITWYADTHQLIANAVARGIVAERDAFALRSGTARLAIDNESQSPFSPEPVPTLVDGRPSSIQDAEGLGRWMAVLRTAWLLMSQPVASVSDAVYDRAARRRIERQGQEAPRVRVITLRRPPSAGSAESDREYHHQWIVRGHWRQQWYPAREVHRPVWIAPHVKGPEGAPLLGGEKVYAWKR